MPVADAVMSDSLDGLLPVLKNRQLQAEVMARAHALAAENYEKRRLWIGIPVIVLTTIVGTTSFVSLADLGKTRIWIACFTAALSVGAAVLAALQTFFDFESRAKKHTDAAIKLNGLVLKCDRLERVRDNQQIDKELIVLEGDYQTIISSAPRVSMGLQILALDQVQTERLLRGFDMPSHLICA
jgi:hypothetical protein